MKRETQNILIYCLDAIGESMAGPAIRSWEFATQLSKNHNVTIMSPYKTQLKSKSFKLMKYTNRSFERELEKADFLIVQKIQSRIAKLANKYDTRIIIDAYDPISVEALEALRHEKMQTRIAMNNRLLLEQSISFMYADSIICASEKQRDFWLGVLSGLNKITPTMYDKDNSLRNLIDVVPFGLSSDAPIKNSEDGLRKKFNLKQSDFVVLWGGGIWDWFDPLSVIRAVNTIKDKIPIKLVFMGIDHPNPGIPRMPMVEKSIELSNRLGLTNKNVFFNEGWVPYKQRQNFLLDANVGISTHYDHLETRFSFRTRILDYIWASLPIIATRGDSFAEIIEENNLGIIVDYDSQESLTNAFSYLYKNKEDYARIQKNMQKISLEFHWENCIKPIESIIEYWVESEPEKTMNVNYATISLTNIHGGYSKRIKRYAKMLVTPEEYKVRMGKLYRSQDIIRRKTLKKAIGLDKKK